MKGQRECSGRGGAGSGSGAFGEEDVEEEVAVLYADHRLWLGRFGIRCSAWMAVFDRVDHD